MNLEQEGRPLKSKTTKTENIYFGEILRGLVGHIQNT